MDTEYDFLTAEFLYLIFFQQKNIVIYPHMDLKHLRGLEVFTVGYNLIDLEATALYNLKGMVKNDIESYSQTPTYHLIYNLDKKKATPLLKLQNVHCILNINQKCNDLIPEAHNDFIFYNKKAAKFLNFDFEGIDLTMENMILSLAKTYEMIRDELQKIKNTATKIYTALNKNLNSLDIDKITNGYTQNEQNKIIQFTENYYDIILPEDLDPKTSQSESHEMTHTKVKTSVSELLTKTAIDFSKEFDIIKNQNKHIFQIFIKELDEYRQKKVNDSNLELNDIFMPNKLYNYLRRHHWSDAISEDFIIQWKEALNANGGVTQDEILDFETILRSLGVQDKVFENVIDGEKSGIKPQSLKIAQNQNQSNSIPNLSNFHEFKSWMISRLDKIEKELKK